jgi:hypothetical protein
MFDINIRADVKGIERKLSDLAYRQMPFATAQALTSLAKLVQDQEKKALPSVFDRPKPFTENAIGVIPARKDNPQAIVYIKDITAAYLLPYEFGGTNKLNSKALLKPVGAKAALDQFGNLPKNYLASLKGRSDIYIGKIKTKNGEVSGVWQRTVGDDVRSVGTARIDKRTGKLRIGKTRKALNQTGHLKLLIRFAEAHPARQHIDWFQRADMLVRGNFEREMGKALARAVATAR